MLEAHYLPYDILGNPMTLSLTPSGEVSARKIILPFRADLVEKMGIAEGDYVLGRPMGAGCPIPHVLKVIKAEPVTGCSTPGSSAPGFPVPQAGNQGCGRLSHDRF